MTGPKQIITKTIAATTVGGQSAAGAVSSSPQLKKKTPLGVIEQIGKRKTLSLYRASTMASGQYSKDVYVLKNRQWEYDHKDSVKYVSPPFAPSGAHQYAGGGFEFWTMGQMTEAEKKRLKRLLTRL